MSEQQPSEIDDFLVILNEFNKELITTLALKSYVKNNYLLRLEHIKEDMEDLLIDLRKLNKGNENG